MTIEIKDRGPGGIAGALKAEATKLVQARVDRALQGLRCPIHGPIDVQGRARGGEIGVDWKPCCEQGGAVVDKVVGASRAVHS
jgi:hypothetical protein